jgi:hypothetical protein
MLIRDSKRLTQPVTSPSKETRFQDSIIPTNISASMV